MSALRNPRFLFFFLVIAVLMVSIAPVGAQAPLLGQISLDLNLDPLWASVNTYFPIFLGVLAVGGGIAIAMALGNYVIQKVIQAFGGGRGK